MRTRDRTRRPTLGVGAAASALLVSALVFGGAVAPASAATGIEVSRDGKNFTSAIAGGLFSKITISVPGDSQSAELYIRNASPAAGYLRVSLTSVTVSNPAIAAALSVSAGTLDFPGAPVALADAQPCRVLTEGDLIASGGVVKLSSALSLGDLRGAVGQNGSASFSLRVSLSETAVGSLLPTECGSGTNIPAAEGDGKIPLAMTGAEPPAAIIMGAASVLGVGLFLVVAARRRREAKE